jgi:hypothetical protein
LAGQSASEAGETSKLQPLKFERIETIDTERRSMQNIVRKLQPAQNEVHKAAHDQDLVEVPKRATLDRVNDGQQLDLPQLVQKDEAEG